MPERIESRSNKFTSKNCPDCGEKKFEFVQAQTYLGIFGLKFMGIGPRILKLGCSNCGYLIDLTSQQRKQAEKLKFRETSSAKEQTTLNKEKSNYYPVLDENRRNKIKTQNRKEGIMSAGIGLAIAIIVLIIPYRPITTIIGLLILAYSLLGGLYGILEDPERNHRIFIDKKIKI